MVRFCLSQPLYTFVRIGLCKKRRVKCFRKIPCEYITQQADDAMLSVFREEEHWTALQAGSILTFHLGEVNSLEFYKSSLWTGDVHNDLLLVDILFYRRLALRRPPYTSVRIDRCNLKAIAGWENEVWQEKFSAHHTHRTDRSVLSDIRTEELHALLSSLDF